MYDISLISSDSLDSELENFFWPVPNEAYSFITPTIIDGILRLSEQFSISEDIRAILISKAFDISSDFSRIARVSIDYSYFIKLDKLMQYNPLLNPILDYFVTNSNKRFKGANIFISQDFNFKSLTLRQFNQFKVNLRRFKYSQNKRLDAFNLNPLLKDFVNQSNKKIVDIRLTEFASKRSNAALPKMFHNLAEIYSNFLIEILKKNMNLTLEMESAIQALAIKSVIEHCKQSYSLFRQVESSNILSQTSEIIISGTPKYSGRLFNYLAQKKGKRIWRFGHGGDRAFFDDYNFSLADFPYCDKYYCHSIGEMKNLRNRFDEKRIAKVDGNDLEFDWQATKKHSNLYLNSNKLTKSKSTKTIMYVSAAYLSEKLIKSPQERCSDAQYLEWQVWLLKKLKSLGYKVITKVHPKGFLSEYSFLKPYSDEICTGYFAAENYKVNCFLFDFGGSAFFEAISSKKGVVYFDMNMRKIDKNSEQHLHERCEIVKCRLDSSNRYRSNISDLGIALEDAAEFNWKETDFYERYVLSNIQ